MTWKIFRSILFTSLIILLAALLMTTAILHDYFSGIQEDELRDVAYVLLASCDAVTRDDILSIFGYSDIDEFYNANNSTNCADAIKMVLA